MVLLPGCQCCGCPCLEGEELPDKVTVTLDGLTKSNVKLNLLSLSFSSCFGSGAAGTVDAPGGLVTESGPITSVELTSGGSGYAKLGRIAPTLAASTANGTGATFTPSFTQKQDGCKLDYWEIASVSVSGGSGYVDGEQVTFSAAEGDTEIQAAYGTIRTGRAQPTLSASAYGGTGAAFTLSYTKNDGDPSTWAISNISVTSGGSGYSGGSSLNITLGAGDVEDAAAYAVIKTNRTQPTLAAGVSGTGSGASLTVSLSSGWGDDYGPTWTVSAIGITNGGSGYSEWDQVTATVTDGQQSYWGYFDAYVTGVDEDGAITSISIYYGGDYYKDEGVITGVELWGGGQYHKDTGVPTSVSIDGRGRYYREDADKPPYVAEVTVSVVQSPPSNGSGAEISAEIDEDTGSATFGHITSITLDDPGDGYLGWSWEDCDVARLNGRTIIVPQSANKCVYYRCISGGSIQVIWRGYATPPIVQVDTDCHITFTADDSDAPFHCDDMSFTATEPVGGTAVVEGGGDELPICSNLYEAESITFEVTAEDWIRKILVDDSRNDCKHRQTAYWPGSRYAGTFELTYDRTISGGLLAGAKVFRYDYGEDDLFCVPPYLEFEVRPDPPHMRMVIHNISTLWRDAYGFNLEELPHADLRCESVTPPNQGWCDKDWKSWTQTDASSWPSCPCDAESLSPATPSYPTFARGSDDQFYTITRTYDGSLLIGFKLISWA